MLKYKYRHNTKFSTGLDPTREENKDDIKIENWPCGDLKKKDFPEPKIIDLDEVFITEDEAKVYAEYLANKGIKNEEIKKHEEKLKFNKVTHMQYKEIMKIYKQKTGPLYYHLGKDVNIYDDPIFQTACKLMIYLKILAYKYQNNEAQKILDLNFTPYINQLKKKFGKNGEDIPDKKAEEDDDENEDKEDIRKTNKVIKEVIDQYNFNFVSNLKDHKYLPEIKEDDYKDTLIFCLHFFNKVIKSCEFVFPVNMFETTQLINTPSVKEEIVDSEDDKDEEEEEEEEDEEERKKKEEDEKKKNEVVLKKNKKENKTAFTEITKRYDTQGTVMDYVDEDNIELDEKNEDKIIELDDDSDLEEIKIKKKKKTELGKKDKDEDDEDNDEDWEIEKKKKEDYELEQEEEKNKDIFNQIKFEKEIQEKKESTKQLKKLHYIFDPKYYYNISQENITEFYENDADRTSSNSKISSLLETIDKFIIEINFKLGDDTNEKSSIGTFAMKYFFDKTMYKYVNIINFCTSLFAVVYLFIFIDHMNYESLTVYYFVYGPLTLLILLNTFTIYMFLRAKYIYFRTIELKKLMENDTDKHISFSESLYANYLDPFLLHNDIIFLIMNLFTSSIMLFRPNYIFLFCFQLTTIINFYPKVEEIFMAFSSKLSQLFAMIIFLAILIYIYAFMGFYFLQGEFDIDTDSVNNNTILHIYLYIYIHNIY